MRISMAPIFAPFDWNSTDFFAFSDILSGLIKRLEGNSIRRMCWMLDTGYWIINFELL